MNTIKGHPTTRHWCGKDNCSGNVSAKVSPYCGHRGPHVPMGSMDGAVCMRIKGHAGQHSAYALSVRVPVEWPAS